MPLDSRGWGGSWIYRSGRVNKQSWKAKDPGNLQHARRLKAYNKDITASLPFILHGFAKNPRFGILIFLSFFYAHPPYLSISFFIFSNIFIYLAVSSLSCHTQDFSCSMWTLSYGIWNLPSQPGTKPGSPALGALDTGQPEKYSHPISDIIHNFS